MKFYTRDWRADLDLSKCSVAARGLWIHMLCIMHETLPYGHMPMADFEDVAHDLRVSKAKVNELLGELESKNVFSRTTDGVIFSRRMVADEEVRLKRSAGGVLGGNPILSRKVNLNGNHLSPVSARADSVSLTSDSESGKGSAEGKPNGKPHNPLPLTPTPDEPAYWIERFEARHPNRKNISMFPSVFIEWWGKHPLPLTVITGLNGIDDLHEKHCNSGAWKDHLAPPLPDWWRDKRWLEPVKERGLTTQRKKSSDEEWVDNG